MIDEKHLQRIPGPFREIVKKLLTAVTFAVVAAATGLTTSVLALGGDEAPSADSASPAAIALANELMSQLRDRLDQLDEIARAIAHLSNLIDTKNAEIDMLLLMQEQEAHYAVERESRIEDLELEFADAMERLNTITAALAPPEQGDD